MLTATARVLRLSLVSCFLLVALAACSGDDTGNAKVSVQVSGLTAASADVASVSVTATNGTTTLTATLTNSGSTWTGAMSGIPAGSGWVFQAVAYDSSNVALFAGSSLPVTIVAHQTATVILELTPVNPPPSFGNHAPHIDSIFVSSDAVGPGDAVQLVVGATDADGDALTYAWTQNNVNGTFTAPSQASTDWSASVDGTYGLTITVTDPHSAYDAVTVSIDVNETNDEGAADIVATINAFPEIQDVILTTGHLQPGVQVTATIDATDSDGDALSYSWSDDCAGTWSPNPDNTAGYTLPVGSMATSCTLRADVSDGRGGANFGTLTVVVGP